MFLPTVLHQSSVTWIDQGLSFCCVFGQWISPLGRARILPEGFTSRG